MLHLRQEYVLQIQSNIFTNKPEMEDSYTLKDSPEDFRGLLASHMHAGVTHPNTAA